MSAFLDQVFAGFDYDQARRELDRLHTEAAEKQSALDAAQAALEAAEADYEAVRHSVRGVEEMIQAYARWRSRRDGSEWADSHEVAALRETREESVVPRPRRGREAVRQLLEQASADTEWSIGDVVEALGL